MDTKLIKEVTDWLKTTDLAEFCYEKDGDCIEVKTAEALPEPAKFTCSLSAVCAPAIGIYKTAAKGKNVLLKEGTQVKEGETLGVVETVSKQHNITAPVAGTLSVIAAEDDKPVEYNQPLFFIEP